MIYICICCATRKLDLGCDRACNSKLLSKIMCFRSSIGCYNNVGDIQEVKYRPAVNTSPRWCGQIGVTTRRYPAELCREGVLLPIIYQPIYVAKNLPGFAPFVYK